MCCTRLAANTGRKKVAKNRHLVFFYTIVTKGHTSLSVLFESSTKSGTCWQKRVWNRLILGHPISHPSHQRPDTVSLIYRLDKKRADRYRFFIRPAHFSEVIPPRMLRMQVFAMFLCRTAPHNANEYNARVKSVIWIAGCVPIAS